MVILQFPGHLQSLAKLVMCIQLRLSPLSHGWLAYLLKRIAQLASVACRLIVSAVDRTSSVPAVTFSVAT